MKHSVYITKKKRPEYYKDKIPVKFSIDTLNVLIKFATMDSEYITKYNLANLNKLLKIIL